MVRHSLTLQSLILRATVNRLLSPSYSMSVHSRSLSRSQNREAPFVGVDLLCEMPLPQYPGLGLSNVQFPQHWVKNSDTTSCAQSIPSTTSEYAYSELIDDDFSSVEGDLLPDEIDQQNLTDQAIEHVARLIADVRHTAVASTVRWIQRCIARNSESVFEDPPAPTGSSYPYTSSDSYHKTEHTQMREQLSMRRRGEKIKLDTESKKPLRRFSFFAGDDRPMITRSAPVETTTAYNTDFSPVMRTGRPQSMIPSPVSEHLLARPRREDSASSLVTSLHRSPGNEGALPRTPSRASSYLSIATAVRQRPSGSNIVEGLNNIRNSKGSRRAKSKFPIPSIKFEKNPYRQFNSDCDRLGGGRLACMKDRWSDRVCSASP